jgi:hypothetical protein
LSNPMDAVMAAAKEYAVAVGKVEDGTFSNCDDEREFLEAAVRSYGEKAIKQEREAKLNSHEEFWLQNRTAILAAVEKAGFRLMSNQHGFWLAAIKVPERLRQCGYTSPTRGVCRKCGQTHAGVIDENGVEQESLFKVSDAIRSRAAASLQETK